MVADLESRRVDAVVNLGDCVSGPLWPCETLAMLRRLGWPTVRGNHDRLVGTTPAANLKASDRFAWEELDDEGRSWLGGLPTILHLDRGIVAFHARPDDDDAYILEDQQGDRLVRADADTVAARLGTLGAAIALTAHSHLPGSLRLPDGRWVINPGSVGCPAYDDDSTTPAHILESGSPAARYIIVETGIQGPMIEFLSIPYATATAVARASANHRPDWAHALATGFALRPKGSA